MQEVRQGKTADLIHTRKRFSSSNHDAKPMTSNVESSKKVMLREFVQKKLQNNRYNNYGFVPTWKKESLLDQLNRSLSVKPNDKVQLPKPLDLEEESEDYIIEKNYFFALIRKIPTDRLLRTEENMGEFAKELPKLNFFFRGHSFLYICSLFKVGKIKFFEPGDIIYDKKMESTDFSIILWGKVRMSDKKDYFKKFSRRGETLSEQILFTNLKTKQEKVTALEQCYLLDIDLKAYHIFYQTMVNNKMKAEVLMMEKNIKRNFIAKNSLRGTRIE